MNDNVCDYILLTALRDCIELRKTMNTHGLSDEKGALSSVSCLLDFLSCRRKYGLTRVIDLKKSSTAERTIGVTLSLQLGHAIRVEHIYTQRQWALWFIEKVDDGLNDRELLSFIDRHYRLILVTLVQYRALRKIIIPRVGFARFDYINLRLDKPGLIFPAFSIQVH